MSRLAIERAETLRIRVRGHCMHGLADGELVPVRRRRVYLPGEILLVRRADHFSAHRFLGYAWSRRGWLALTRADDAGRADPAAPIDRIEGSVRRAVTLRERARAARWYAQALLDRLRRPA